MIAISGCLLGEKCRYDGGSKPVEEFLGLNEEMLVICPELLGGLSTPRSPAEISGGDGFDVLDGRARVMDSAGRDVTDAYVAGAYKALELCREKGITRAILKGNSPSCGARMIYDGSFSGAKKPGAGVTAALFIRNGIEVENERE